MRAITILLTTALAATAAAPLAAQDAAAGRQLYLDFCAVCHGPGGTGDGVMAEVLTIPPTDLTALGRGDAFPILRVAEQVDGRRALLAHGGEMPIFGPWFEGDGADVAMAGPGGQPILMSRPIADLVAYLREIQS
jgi:mono/diheme cytochrome c family protein